SSGGCASSGSGGSGSRSSRGNGRKLLLAFADQVSDGLALEGIDNLVGLLHDVLGGRAGVASEGSEEIRSKLILVPAQPSALRLLGEINRDRGALSLGEQLLCSFSNIHPTLTIGNTDDPYVNIPAKIEVKLSKIRVSVEGGGMRSALEAAGDQSIPPTSPRWRSPMGSTRPPPPPTVSHSPTRVITEEPESHSQTGTSGMEPGMRNSPSSGSPTSAQNSPPREVPFILYLVSELIRDNSILSDGDEPQPSTSRAHSDFVETSSPMKLLNPKLEPLDEESSRDGFTPLSTLATIKSEPNMGRSSEMRSEDSRSETSNVDVKRYRVSFKEGIAGVQVDRCASGSSMVSTAAKAKERAAEELARRPTVPTPLPPPIIGLSYCSDVGGPQMMRGPGPPQVGMVPPPPGYQPHSVPGGPHGHPGMHSVHMAGAPGAPPQGHMGMPHPQMGDGQSGSGPSSVGQVPPPSAIPHHMQQQRQPQTPPTNSPILVNLLNSQQHPPPAATGRPFSPYTPVYPGGPPSGPGGVAPPPGQPGGPGQMDMALYHQQMYAGQPPQAGMYPPQGPPNVQQRVPYPTQQGMYGAMPQIKQVSIHIHTKSPPL
ncbi:hypothetical protein PFISCL1PPCAC_19477, partial [Pristionchus fissidentatus]